MPSLLLTKQKGKGNLKWREEKKTTQENSSPSYIQNEIQKII